MVICIAEDRQREEIAVKLLLLSLAKHCPHVPIELFFPPATEAFKAWAAALPQVHLRTTPIATAAGWDIKPYALLKLLTEGHREVWWIDSDIIVTRDFRQTIAPLTDADLVIAEEALYGHYRDEGYRARAWGFALGRSLPFNLNSGVMRVTQAHRLLLQQWQQLLETEVYQQAQQQPYGQKPFHLFGDQDVLTTLLSTQEFAHIPLRILKRGTAIIQYFGLAGYTIAERLQNLVDGMPPFIHAQREKPWHRSLIPPGLKPLRPYLDFVQMDISPYCFAAAPYRSQLAEDLPWLDAHSRLGKILRGLGLGNAAFIGLPIALGYSVIRAIKQMRGIDDRFDPQQAYQRVILAQTDEQTAGKASVEKVETIY
ncbi:hypothetical protein NDI45_02295 [Leptolyngbya sp. GB1-A1]|uniref:nucleotide-diphospho-sugar transferase n=1 Tax=Leptolyngbya sp. GB1-A1 TaxID=2933908 RepID=UPI003299E29F